ncbi:hypothetical protein F3Y22_tig00110904pilonHSYRG00245 [Hibiscus syriacus]|uniref:RNase H type-1 domain-containing protein n=1 Tax=Hibiscus syriacus TaxID=106335 RepID=A0A6A2ZG02_HIBSY|nr:hypothetical protein F3Y22_tig00110904pilonHSYRG00245 [Hibiscus syriacus]
MLLINKDKLEEFMMMEINKWIWTNLSKACYFSNDIKEWDIMFGAILWNTWCYRNSIVFDNLIEDNMGIIERSRRLRGLMRRAADQEEEAQRRVNRSRVGGTVWTAPPEHWITVNTDGSRNVANELASCGGVILNNAIEWLVGFEKFIGLCSILKAELWGVYVGLYCAWNTGNGVTDKLTKGVEPEIIETHVFYYPPIDILNVLMVDSSLLALVLWVLFR